MNVDIIDNESFWFQKPYLQIHTTFLLLLLSNNVFLHFHIQVLSENCKTDMYVYIYSLQLFNHIHAGRAGPSLYGAISRIYLGAPQCRQYDWLLSKLDYSHTINLTHLL